MKQYLTIPNICPVCGGNTKIEVSDSGTEILVCTNPQCEGKLVNVLDHYASKKGLDIKGLSKATLEKLINWGWITEIADLYNLKNYRNEWINQSGFGIKSVDNILQAIDNSRNCQLHAFISALGIPLIGTTVAKDLAKNFCSWSNLRNAIKSKFKFSTLPNFGYEMEKSILSYSWEKVDNLIEYGNIQIQDYIVEEKEENDLEGMTICITGKLKAFKNRDDLKLTIERCGGKVTGSVTNKTSILINNDITSTSAKNVTAIKLGIPIMTEKEFINNFFN